MYEQADKNTRVPNMEIVPSVFSIEKDVKRQQEEQFLAVISRGEYCLASDFQFLKVEESDCYKMSTSQKDELK